MNLLEARLAESRQRALNLADRLEEADRRACAAEQQLASEKQQHQIMDAAYWAAAKRAEVAEAKLAVATDGIGRIMNRCNSMGEFDDKGLLISIRQECADLLSADPSQAAAQYQRAIQVVERVKDDTFLEDVLIRWAGVSPQNFQAAALAQAQKELLGDAVQEESPLDPSAGEDAVIERLREMEEKP